MGRKDVSTREFEARLWIQSALELTRRRFLTRDEKRTEVERCLLRIKELVRAEVEDCLRSDP